MFVLKCDLCGLSISPIDEKPCVEISIEEQKYRGGTQFIRDTECYSTSKILCPRCAKRLSDFLNLQVQYFEI